MKRWTAYRIYLGVLISQRLFRGCLTTLSRNKYDCWLRRGVRGVVALVDQGLHGEKAQAAVDKHFVVAGKASTRKVKRDTIRLRENINISSLSRRVRTCSNGVLRHFFHRKNARGRHAIPSHCNCSVNVAKVGWAFPCRSSRQAGHR